MDSRLELSLRTLVERVDASTRLANVAKKQELLATTTVGEFIANRSAVVVHLLNLPNFGRKSLSELATAVDNYARSLALQPDSVCPDVVEEITSSEAADSGLIDDENLGVLPSEFRGLSLRTLVEAIGASIRLTRAVSQTAWFAETTVQSYLNGNAEPLPSTKNLGRRSLLELQTLVNDFVIVSVEIVDKATSDAASARNLGELRNMASVVRTAFRATAARRFAHSDLDKVESSEEAVHAAIKALETNERFVLERRYGLSGFQPMTLEEVGTAANVTRERVRQVEHKALGRLRASAGLLFQRYLNDQSVPIAETLSGGYGVVSSGALSRNRPKLLPFQLLAIDVQFAGIEGWLLAFGRLTASGWQLRANQDTIADEQRRNIENYLTRAALPRPLSDVADSTGVVPDTCRTVIAGLAGFSCFDNFVFKGFVGARAKRVVALYHAAQNLPAIFDVQTLVATHRRAHPEDQVGSRIILTALDEHRHLFGRLFDALWVTLPLPAGFPGDNVGASLPFERRALGDDGGFDRDTIGHELVRTLHESGSCRINDLADRIELRHGTRSSTSPILVTNPCFQRIAPGVFDLYSGDTFRESELLGTQQCRNYAYARFGGAPRDYFPAWSAAYERRLAEWARFNAPTDVFRSLLAILSPGEWDDPSAASDWSRLRETHGTWSLRTNREKQLSGPLPTPEAFFAGLVHLALLGSISWCGANRVSQQRLDSEAGAELVALLVTTGAAEPATDWQAPHSTKQSTSELLSRVASERWNEGQLDWTAGYLAELLEAAQQSSATAPVWVPASELQQFLESPPTTEETGAAAATTDANSEIDEFLDSDDWSKLFEI